MAIPLGERNFWVHSVNVVENFLPLQVIDFLIRRNAVARSRTDSGVLAVLVAFRMSLPVDSIELVIAGKRRAG